MLKEKCRYFESCNVPMCPLDEGLENYTWFPDEDICIKQPAPAWVKNQKKISKICKGGYFTLEMLKRNCVIKTGIKGLDSDREEKSQLKKWLRDHPVKRKLSDEEKEKRIARLTKNKV